MARPFPVNADHLRQALAQERKALPLPTPCISEYVATLLARVQRGEDQDAYARLIADVEPELYAQAIRLAQGNQVRAAPWLGVTRVKLREKLKELGLHPKQEQRTPSQRCPRAKDLPPGGFSRQGSSGFVAPQSQGVGSHAP